MTRAEWSRARGRRNVSIFVLDMEDPTALAIARSPQMPEVPAPDDFLRAMGGHPVIVIAGPTRVVLKLLREHKLPQAAILEDDLLGKRAPRAGAESIGEDLDYVVVVSEGSTALPFADMDLILASQREVIDPPRPTIRKLTGLG